MKGRYVMPTSSWANVERNIYADKSSVVVAWLLLQGVEKEYFSLREVALATGVGLGSVHRVFEFLVLHGFLRTEGIRTNKKFFVHNAPGLLSNWLENYNIMEKCRVFAYSTPFQHKEEVIDALLQSGLQEHVALALHSSAEAHKCKNTNLKQLELYIMKPDLRKELEKALELFPKERGYDVLLIEPYYKAFLNRSIALQKHDLQQLFNAPALLTFLDLYHFPLRGIEQAEFMATRLGELKRIYKKK